MLRSASQSKLLKRKRPYRIRRLFDRLGLCLAFAFVLFGLYCYKHTFLLENGGREPTTKTKTKLRKEGKCEALVHDWVSLQEQRYAQRAAQAKKINDKRLTFFSSYPANRRSNRKFLFPKTRDAGKGQVYESVRRVENRFEQSEVYFSGIAR